MYEKKRTFLSVVVYCYVCFVLFRVSLLCSQQETKLPKSKSQVLMLLELQHFLSLSYFVQRMHHGQVALQRHCKNLIQQVRTEFKQIKFCTSHEDLGHQPVVLRISRRKDWVVLCWFLLQLQEEEKTSKL